MSISPAPDLADTIQELNQENVHLCYQCVKCTAGCPAAAFFDLKPHQIVRALQFGQKDLLLKSRTIWLCTQCEACVTRCPNDIDIPAIMDELRIMAFHDKVEPAVRSIPIFYNAALRGVNLFGRMYEAGLMGELYLRLALSGEMDFGQLFSKDVPMAAKMVRDGKLRPMPSLARYPKKQGKTAARVADPERIAYYPGCSLHGTSQEFDMSVHVAMEKLGVALEAPKGWVCCGTTPAHSTDHVLSTVLPLRNVSLIERAGHSYATAPCPLCFVRLRTAMNDIQDPELQQAVLARAPDLVAVQAAGENGAETDPAVQGEQGRPYLPASDTRVDHLLTTLTERIGYERVAQAVVRPLEGLKVVCYYGCVITRPPALTGIENYEYPTHMDRLVETLGAEPLDWSYKTECCGASLSITKLDIAMSMTERILRDARAVGADAVVVACPFCHVNLDSRQKQIEEQFEETLDLPVFFVTQLMGLAFGAAPKALGLSKHFVDPLPLLRRAGLGV